jgi:hypothetical protein
VFDAAGIGQGGSGAAAGLLHPLTPKGRMLWRGEEALADAMQLLQVAEQAACQAGEPCGRISADCGASATSGSAAGERNTVRIPVG